MMALSLRRATRLIRGQPYAATATATPIAGTSAAIIQTWTQDS